MAYQRFNGFGSVQGVFKDKPPTEVPNNFWTDVINVKFNQGQATLAEGYTHTFAGNTEDPNWVLPRVEGSTAYWYYGSDTKISRTEGTSHADISRLVDTGDGLAYTSGDWNGCSLNGVLVFNNNTNYLQVLEGGGSTFEDSASFPTTLRAKVVRSYKNYLFALNLTDDSENFPYTLRWSDAADPGLEPGSWDIANQAVDAGQTQLADTVGSIVDGLSLRDSFIIYKTDAVYSVSFIGGAFIFNFRKIFDKWGMLSTNCASHFNGKHFVVGQDDIYVHDGVQQASVAEQTIKDFFYSDLNPDFIDRVHVTPSYKETEMWVNYPSNNSNNTGDCDKALVWNWQENLWTIRELPDIIYSTFGIVDTQGDDQWDSAVGSWDQVTKVWNDAVFNPAKTSVLLVSKTNSKFYKVGEESTFDGADFNWRLEKTSVDFDNPYDFKYISTMLPKLVGSGSLNISVGTQDRISEGISWSTPVAFDPLLDIRAYFKKQGRYISFKFEGTSATQFRLAGYEVEMTGTGEK